MLAYYSQMLAAVRLRYHRMQATPNRLHMYVVSHLKYQIRSYLSTILISIRPNAHTQRRTEFWVCLALRHRM